MYGLEEQTRTSIAKAKQKGPRRSRGWTKLLVLVLLVGGARAQASWPPTTGELVFLWENGKAANTVPTDDGGTRVFRLVPEAGATLDRYAAMDLRSGAFRAESETNALLRKAIRDADAFTVEALLTHDGEPAAGFYEIVSFGLTIWSAGACHGGLSAECDSHGFVLGGRFNLVFFGLAGPDSRGARVFDVGFKLGDRPRHLLVTFDAGAVTVFLDGKRALGHPRLDGLDLSASDDAALVFGAPGRWSGSAEAIALYTRAFTAADATAHYAALADRLVGR